MGLLLVEAAGLMWGRVAVASPGPGGGLGALRLPPLGTVGSIGVVCTIRGIMFAKF